MACFSWKVFSSSRTSRTNDPDGVLFMLDEIPTDTESTNSDNEVLVYFQVENTNTDNESACVFLG